MIFLYAKKCKSNVIRIAKVIYNELKKKIDADEEQKNKRQKMEPKV